MRRLAVIPARSGSKRIPKKNIRPLAGKPLISYSIKAAIDSGLFNRVIVSTDSDEIAEIAVRWGAEVPYLRPATLADDYVPVSSATADVVERVLGGSSEYTAVAQLMPTCPLRTAEDVRESFRQFDEVGPDSQISVTRFGWQNPWWAVTRKPTYELDALFRELTQRRSQDLPELFCPSGAIWWARPAVLRDERTFHVANRTGWEIPWHRGVDIDTEDDWTMAAVLLDCRVRGKGASRQCVD
jgi:N-acylneuraminate cytidylyltransferase